MGTDAVTKYLDIDRGTKHFRVDRAVYRDAEVFERERELIFGRCWLYALHVSELKKPGDYIRRSVGGKQLLFTLDQDHKIHALYNICTHRGSPVCQDNGGNRKVFSCPYHGWVFDLQGRLRDQAAVGGGYAADFNESGRYNLQRPPLLDSYRGWYFINFNANAISLADYLAEGKYYLDLMADQSEIGLEVISGGQEFTCEANWKHMMENQFDSYHGSILHSTYFDFLKTVAPATGNFTLAKGFTASLGNGHGLFQTAGVTGRPIAQWVPPFGEETRGEIAAIRQRLTERFGEERAFQIAETNRNFVIFPNLIINDNFSISTRTVYPLAPDRMHVTIWAMGPREETPHFRAMRLDNYLSFTGPAGFATPDDIEIFEATQRHGLMGWSDVSKGMNSDDDFFHGRSGPLDEAQVRGWWAQWDRIVGNADALLLKEAAE